MTADPNQVLMPGRAQYPSLADRAVFITGGASGIGASMVEHFCDQGSRVAFVDVRSDLAQALIADLAARGLPSPWYRECDLRDIEALRAAITDAGRAMGPLRVLVKWCEVATSASARDGGRRYRFVYVDQTSFEQNTPQTFAALATSFTEYQDA